MVDLPSIVVLDGVMLYLRTAGKTVIYEEVGTCRYDFENRKQALDFILNSDCHTYNKDNTIWRN